jgi:hypothetical protein
MPNENTLFGQINSLFRRKSSLFDCVGNSIKEANHYGWLGLRIRADNRPELRKFPVFSPDNRESNAENGSLVTAPSAN